MSKRSKDQNSHQQRSAHSDAIQFSNPKLPVPSLNATIPVNAPLKHYTDILFYEREDGIWKKSGSEFDLTPDSSDAVWPSTSSAALATDSTSNSWIRESPTNIVNLTRPEVQETLSTSGVRSKDVPHTRDMVISLAILVQGAFTEFTGDQNLSTPLSRFCSEKDSIEDKILMRFARLSLRTGLRTRFQFDGPFLTFDNLIRGIENSISSVMRRLFEQALRSELLAEEITSCAPNLSVIPNFIGRLLLEYPGLISTWTSIQKTTQWYQHDFDAKDRRGEISNARCLEVLETLIKKLDLADRQGDGMVTTKSTTTTTIWNAVNCRLLKISHPVAEQLVAYTSHLQQSKGEFGSPEPAERILLSFKQHFSDHYADIQFDTISKEDYKEYDKQIQLCLSELDRIKEQIWECFMSMLEQDGCLSQNHLHWVLEITE